MSRRPVPSTDRPTLEHKRRSVLQFFREEWGLLGLAAALTLMTWYVTRLGVEKPELIKKVRLVLHVDAEDQMALPKSPGTINLKMLCSKSELEEARAGVLDQQGAIHVNVDARSGPGWSDLTDSNATFLYPFPKSYVDPEPTSLVGKGWLYTVQTRVVEVEMPTVKGATANGEQILPEFEDGPPKITLRAPVDGVGGTLRPDPIDSSAVLADRQGREEMPYTLTFKNWAKEPPDEALRVFRESVLPSLNFTVTLRFGRIEERLVSNRAIYDVPNAEWYDFEVTTSRRDVGLNVSEPDVATLPIRAPDVLLRALEDEERQQGWCWGIRFKGDLPTEPGKPVTVRAEMVLMRNDPEFLDPRIEFKPTQETKGFDVEVTLRKRQR